MIIKSLLIVCVGNMCRSPTAEYLLKSSLNHVEVSSAGLMARENKPPCSKATDIAAVNGLNISSHKTRKLNQEMVIQSDLILAMESGHAEEILSTYPFAHGKVILFGRWGENTEVPDPYRQSDEMYQAVFAKLNEHAQKWVHKLEHPK